MTEPGGERASALRATGQRYPLAPMVIAVLLFGTGPVLIAISAASGPVFAFWRLAIGTAAFAVVGVANVRRNPPDARAWRWSLWGGLAFSAHQLLFFSALKATVVTDVVLMNTLAPIVTAVIAIYWFGERPGPVFRVWTLVAVVGAAIVAVAGSVGPTGNPLGMGMAASNVVFFAIYLMLAKSARVHIAVLPFLLGVMAVAAVAVGMFVAVTGASFAVSRTDLLLAAIVATGPGLFGHFLMTWPMRWVPANIPPLLMLGQPIVAGVLAWMFIGEGITLAHAIGGGLTIAGVAAAILSASGRRFLEAASEPPAA